MDADDLIDARLREAGARWREKNTMVAQTEPPAAPQRRTAPPRHWAPLLSAAVLAATLVVGGWFVLNRDKSTPSADGRLGLTATVWQLLGYGQQQSDTGSSAMLYIDRAGHLVADDDCALIVGTARTDGDTLRVADLALRSKSCTDQNGAAFAPSGTDILRGPATYQVSGATLTITRDGKPPMHLRVASSTTVRPTADIPTLIGSDWRLAAITDEAGTPTTPRGDPRLHIADDGTLAASDGCNTLSGPTTTPGGGELRFGELATTEIGCVGPTAATAAAVDAILSGSVTQSVQGNQLTLTKAGVGALVYLWKPQDAALTDSAALVGRTWRLASVAGDPAAASTATLSISHGRIVVADGCRDLVGSAYVGAGGLIVSGLPATRPGCAGVVGNQAVTIDSIVRNGRISWSIRDGKLIVPGGGAQAFALVYRSAAPPVDPSAQLVGPLWMLTQYERTSADTSSGASVTSRVTLSFDGNGHYVATGSCSPRGGSVVIGAGTLTLSEPSAGGTGRACAGSPDKAQNAAVNTVLRGRVTWAVQGRLLTITKDGVGALTYRRS